MRAGVGASAHLRCRNAAGAGQRARQNAPAEEYVQYYGAPAARLDHWPHRARQQRHAQVAEPAAARCVVACVGLRQEEAMIVLSR